MSQLPPRPSSSLSQSQMSAHSRNGSLPRLATILSEPMADSISRRHSPSRSDASSSPGGSYPFTKPVRSIHFISSFHISLFFSSKNFPLQFSLPNTQKVHWKVVEGAALINLVFFLRGLLRLLPPTRDRYASC